MSLSHYNIEQLHLSKSAVTDKVYAGFISSDGKSFNKKKDVTAEFIKTLVDRNCGYEEEFSLNGKDYKVIVKEVTDESNS